MNKEMKTSKLKRYRTFIVSIFSFLLGCMVTINLVPIDKTCKLDDTDREFNIMKNSKLKNPELIVLIFSAPKNLAKRNTIRETWLKLKDRGEDHGDVKFKMKHFFAIGSFGLDPDSVLHLSNEQSEFNDILILPIYDSYSNLSFKVLKSFEWLDEQYDFGLGFKYVLKSDDDSFVRIDSLLHELAQIEIIYLKSDLKEVSLINDNTSPYITANAQRNDKHAVNNMQLYWGYFHGNAKVKATGKWKESNWILCDDYLPYALGGGYILSKNLVSFLAKNANDLRLYSSEDVSVGVWLSSVNNIMRIHDRRFDTEWTTRGCQNYYLVTHNVSINMMKELYENVVSSNNLCSQEILKRKYYLYDWSVPPTRRAYMMVETSKDLKWHSNPSTSVVSQNFREIKWNYNVS